MESVILMGLAAVAAIAGTALWVATTALRKANDALTTARRGRKARTRKPPATAKDYRDQIACQLDDQGTDETAPPVEESTGEVGRHTVPTRGVRGRNRPGHPPQSG
jgi:hypothetical protein